MWRLQGLHHLQFLPSNIQSSTINLCLLVDDFRHLFRFCAVIAKMCPSSCFKEQARGREQTTDSLIQQLKALLACCVRMWERVCPSVIVCSHSSHSCTRMQSSPSSVRAARPFSGVWHTKWIRVFVWMTRRKHQLRTVYIWLPWCFTAVSTKP